MTNERILAMSKLTICSLRARVAVLLMLSMVLLEVSAEDRLDLDDEDLPIVLSASRLIQPLSSSPASITIIDAEMIELSGARTIVDLLHLVPGMQVGRLVNGNPIATYHGLSERYNPRLQLIIDGRPTYVPLYGGIPWSELPLALTDIERIEVIRAPNAATFGPNSFAAVVSITTRSPEAGSGWYINTEAGGNDFRSGTLSYYGAGRDANYRITLQSERDEGFRNIPDKERSAIASVRSNWQLNAVDRIGIDIGGTAAGHIELDSVAEENDLAAFEDTRNAYTQFVWERSRSADDSTRIQYYYNFFDIRDAAVYTFDLAAATGNDAFTGLTVDANIDRDSRSTRHELEVQRSRRLNSRHRLVYGAAARRDSVQGRFIFNDTRTRYISTQRLFAHSEYSPKNRWLLNSGVLIENNSLSNLSASPRFSLTYDTAPGQQIRLGYSRGTRTPLLLEEEGDVTLNYVVSTGEPVVDQFIVNRNDIKPERIDVVDLAYHYNSAGQGLSIDTKLSYHELRDLIGTRTINNLETDTFDGVARAYENRFEYRFSNIEVQLDYRMKRRYRVRAGYSYAFGLDRSLEERKLTPRHTLSLFTSARLSQATTVSAEYYYTSQWIWDDVRDESRLNRLDLRLAKNFRVAGLNASAALQAELDLGDTVDYLQRNQIDDLYFARVSVQLP